LKPPHNPRDARMRQRAIDAVMKLPERLVGRDPRPQTVDPALMTETARSLQRDRRTRPVDLGQSGGDIVRLGTVDLADEA